MSELKFACPHCEQRIAVDAQASGQTIECPGCRLPIMVPAPPPEAGAAGHAPSAAHRTHPPRRTPSAPAGSHAPPSPVRPPGSNGPPDAPPAAAAPPKGRSVRFKSAQRAAAVLESLHPQIGALTPSIKKQIILAVRECIAEESRWVPGRNASGKPVYAVRPEGQDLVPVSISDPAATRYSLWGALLRELQSRYVTQTATGRTELLDQEIPAAIRSVLLRSVSEADRKAGPDPLASKDPLSISHAQCLQVLDVLAGRSDSTSAPPRAPSLPHSTVDIEELLERLARNESVTSSEIIHAFHAAVQKLESRLIELEKQG
ncbi:MAG TPA: hypothetical protein P5555_09310 [Candidatus Paceibacterota bacterium]|nr:hypothetical protein [Verrucomicrobiota bacterium]HRZ45373.1 hypothetical protein [Candidatus Paceibacterota bacterium]